VTIEQAVELVLSGEGRVTCMCCEGDGIRLTDRGDLWFCGSCEGAGYLASEDLLKAHELLDMEPPDLVPYAMGRLFDP
jgi:hypothetical protein